MTGGPPVRELGWDSPGVSLLEQEQVARRCRWLLSAVRDVPGLTAEPSGSDAVRLNLNTPERAARFQAALRAENVPADLADSAVILRVTPWYSPVDVRSLALAVTKVAYYLLRKGTPADEVSR